MTRQELIKLAADAIRTAYSALPDKGDYPDERPPEDLPDFLGLLMDEAQAMAVDVFMLRHPTLRERQYQPDRIEFDGLGVKATWDYWCNNDAYDPDVENFPIGWLVDGAPQAELMAEARRAAEERQRREGAERARRRAERARLRAEQNAALAQLTEEQRRVLRLPDQY